MIHELKTLPEFFQPIKSGIKQFEIRLDDRKFMVGDTLILQEYTKEKGYTGDEQYRTVTYTLTGERWGIKPGYIIMGIKPVRTWPAPSDPPEGSASQDDLKNQFSKL